MFVGRLALQLPQAVFAKQMSNMHQTRGENEHFVELLFKLLLEMWGRELLGLN